MNFPDAFQFFLYETTRYLSPQAVAAEWILLAMLAISVALLLYRMPLRQAAGQFSRLAQHRSASVALCFLLPVAIRLSLLGIMPVPTPSIHDEFSHLLLGDTLAHGGWQILRIRSGSTLNRFTSCSSLPTPPCIHRPKVLF